MFFLNIHNNVCIIFGTGQSITYLGQVPYTNFKQQLNKVARSKNDFASLASLPNQINEPVTSRPNMWATFPNLRTLGYALPKVPQDSTLSVNIDICNLDRVDIDPQK